MRAASIRVQVFHPADPLGTAAGGIETFIRGAIGGAPEDIQYNLVGITTDAAARPPRVWTVCEVGTRRFRFFPVLAEVAARPRSLPLTLRYCLAALPHLKALRQGFDILEVHRIEPALLFRGDRRPVNAFVHQDMADVRNPQTENRWRHLPGLYFHIEDRLLPRFDSVYCVREATVDAYKARHPAQADRFRFMPTWMDPAIFHPADGESRKALRERLAATHGIRPGQRVIIFVGRLDAQKNVELLIRSFAIVAGADEGLRLLIVGDGALAASLRRQVGDLDLKDKVVFAGAQPVARVADLLRSADLFAMSSAFEGMSMSLLEAMGCGLPVVSTNVGEVRRLVVPGKNGEIASEHTVAAFAEALRACLDRLDAYAGEPAISAASAFVPSVVLGELFDTYRRLHRLHRRPLAQGVAPVR